MGHLHRRAFLYRGLGTTGLIGFAAWHARAGGDEGADAVALTEKAVRFLRPRQGADGSWSAERKEPGITALVVTALLRSGRVTASEPVIIKGLGYLEKFVGPKGGLSKAPHSVYATSVALMAFQEANQADRYASIIKGGQDYLKSTQIDEGEGKSRDDASYGGLGYGGGNSRPDLSNTSFFMEALHDTGLPPDDLALQKALIFVSRSQNLKSEFNDQPWAGKVNDGGFVYVPPTRGGGAGKGTAGKGADGPLQKVSRKPTPFRGGMKACGLCCSGLQNNTCHTIIPSWVKHIVARKRASSCSTIMSSSVRSGDGRSWWGRSAIGSCRSSGR